MTKPSTKCHMRLLGILLLIFSGIAGAVIYFGIIQKLGKPVKNIKIDGIYLSEPTALSDFNLTDQLGKPFTKENMRGHWTMLFFGFTNCGMVCPTTMAELNKMYKILQRELPDSKLPLVVMVSVDPDRDTISRMKSYVTAFNPHFMGVRGEAEETDALQKQLHIVSVKMQAQGKGKDHYTINHSAEIMLFNPDVELQAFLSFPHAADQMVADYKLILSAESKS